MDRFTKGFAELEYMQELAAKYSDYTSGDSTKIPYHDPETKEQQEKAEKVRNADLRLMVIVSAAFILTLILMIVSGSGIGWILFIAAVTAFPVVMAVKTKTQKVQVITGRAVYKQKERRGSNHRMFDYYISFIPDGDEKIIYSRIQISKEDYEQVTEGTPVLVVKEQHACLL